MIQPLPKTKTDSSSLVLSALQANGLDTMPSNLTEQLAAISPEMVRAELKQEFVPFSLQRLMTLISPAAADFLEEMAHISQRLTRQRFGMTMNLYAPLYLSNLCVNKCLYCGFNTSHKIPRQHLSIDEAITEAKILIAEGFQDILLVAGEDRNNISIDYLEELAKKLAPIAPSLALEIYPLECAEYQRLFDAGIEAVTLYQETYDRKVYTKYHLAGPKANYANRLKKQEDAARAGMRRLGIGALLGLQDWRYEMLALGIHAQTLIKHFSASRVSVSFPRLRPAPEIAELAAVAEQTANVSLADDSINLKFQHLVKDKDLAQMVFALRLSFPDVALILSTREKAAFRNNLIPLGITQISAGSKTNPGGYGDEHESSEQFEVADTRSAAEISVYLKNIGYDPVWKDWDKSFA
jgi:2-iminoacetate synthase